jgi:biofilm protein TabA
MIVAALDDLPAQMAGSARMKKAMDFLQANRTAEGLGERVEIDDKDVYAMFQVFETVPPGAEIKLEAHRQYIDIQYIVSGEEVMGWAHVSELHGATPYNPEKDVFEGTLPAARLTPVLVKPGQAAVFFPEDAHAPKLAAGQPARVKKIVVKVRVR